VVLKKEESPKKHKRGPWHHQSCWCKTKPNCEKTEFVQWPDFDFNQVATTCFCCSKVIIPSGYDNSPIFFDGCNELVQDYSRSNGVNIPIGRRPYMNNIVCPESFRGIEYDEYKHQIDYFFKQLNIIRE